MSSTSTTPTITRYRGDTVPDRVYIVDEVGVAVDITTGYSFKLTVNVEQNPVDTLQQIFVVNGVVFNGPLGIVDFTPTSIQADQTPGYYYYDMQVTYPALTIKTVEKGKYVFKQDITKT